MGKSVTISVITATYNCANTLPECFASVARQDYTNYEHVVVDGASTDGTVRVISNHISQIALYKSEPDNGIYDALNKGLQMARGEVIGFLHGDDMYASNNVLSLIAHAFEDPSVAAVYGDLTYVSKGNIDKVIRRWKSRVFNIRYLSLGWMPPHPSLYIRREWYERFGGFDTSYRVSADYLHILKLFKQDKFISAYVPEVFVLMRVGGTSNKSLINIINKTLEDWKILRQSGFNMFYAVRALIFKNISKIMQFI